MGRDKNQHEPKSPQAKVPRQWPAKDLELDDEERYQVMVLLLPDFIRDTDELLVQLVNGNSDSVVYTVVLGLKRVAFHSLRQHYSENLTANSPFIDPAWVAELNDARIVGAILRANIVHALDHIGQIKDKRFTNDKFMDTSTFLQHVAAALTQLFTPGESNDVYWKLALDLRTCYLIELMVTESRRPNLKKCIAAVFCEDADIKDVTKLLTKGPFKRLTIQKRSRIGEEERDVILKRISHLLSYSPKNRITRMRDEYPLDKTLDDLRNYLLARYVDLEPTGTTKCLVSNGPPEARRNSLPGAQVETDGYEKDAGQIPESSCSNSEAHSATQAIERQRVPINFPFNGPPGKRPHPCPSNETSGSAPTTFTQPDDDAIRLRKRLVVEGARAHIPNFAHVHPSLKSSRTNRTASGLKQRRAWSDNDSSLLIRLVAEKKARWAVIEKYNNHEFEHPRGQQGYRDKARNMKVDFLMTDAVLPPGFDQVVLGQKEVGRLLTLRKNPYRKVKDVDQNGKAIHTQIESRDEADEIF